MLDQVARESAKGRRLFIGTTNLDADRAVIWDMGAIAASNRPDRLKLFKQVILASTSIPGIFPPVHVEVTAAGKTYDEMHVDGGTTMEVFLMPAGLTLGEINRTFHTRVKARLYIIRNGRTTPEPSIVKATLPGIAEKAVSSLIKTQGIGDLYRLYAIAKRDGIDYNFIDIPTDFTVEAKSPFDNKFMRALYETGYRDGSRRRAVEKGTTRTFEISPDGNRHRASSCPIDGRLKVARTSRILGRPLSRRRLLAVNRLAKLSPDRRPKFARRFTSRAERLPEG